MANYATISKTSNGIIYIQSHKVEAQIEDVNQFYDELEIQIAKMYGKFVLLVDMSNAKWLDRDARMQMAKRSKELIEKYEKKYIGKILVFNSGFTRSLISLFNIAAKTTAPQYTVKSINEGEELANGILNNKIRILQSA